jgi:hypothetical protein
MDSAQQRHGISDHVWGRLELYLPGREGAWGGKARDNWQFINAIFWTGFSEMADGAFIPCQVDRSGSEGRECLEQAYVKNTSSARHKDDDAGKKVSGIKLA